MKMNKGACAKPAGKMKKGFAKGGLVDKKTEKKIKAPGYGKGMK